MNIFLEKEFIENFEIEFSDNKSSEAWRTLYLVFTEYPNIVCYLNTDSENLKEVILASELLSKLSDINPRICPCNDFRESNMKENSAETTVICEQ